MTIEYAYEQMAERLGKTREDLTEEEEKQARLNEVTRWILCGIFVDEMLALRQRGGYSG